MAESSADRPRVKLSAPAPEPVPEWFARAFAQRQRKLRARLEEKLAAVGAVVGELTANQIHQMATHWDRLEVQHALDDLVAAGVLEQETRTEPLSASSRKSKDFTYYSLTSKEPSREHATA